MTSTSKSSLPEAEPAILRFVNTVGMAARPPGFWARLGHEAGLFSLRSAQPLLPVTDEAFQLALSLDAPAIGPNDRLHVGACIVHGIDAIVSADSEFDAVRGIRRIDPLDAQARRRLLRNAEEPDQRPPRL